MPRLYAVTYFGTVHCGLGVAEEICRRKKSGAVYIWAILDCQQAVSEE